MDGVPAAADESTAAASPEVERAPAIAAAAEALSLRFGLPLLLLAGVVFELLGWLHLAAPPHGCFAPGNAVPFLAFGMLLASIVQLASLPARGPARQAELAGVALLSIALGWPMRGDGYALAAAMGLGEASAVVLACRALVGPQSRRSENLRLLSLGLGLPLFLVVTASAISFTEVLHPRSYDGALYLADTSLGGSPAFALQRWLAPRPYASAGMEWMYNLLPLAIGAVLAARPPKEAQRASAKLIDAVLLAGALGFCLYNLCPAIGPAYAFADAFARAAPPLHASAGLVPVPNYPRNCMPSLHVTWALLAFWSTRPLSRGWRLFTALWLAGTVLATLGLGEHYGVDLVVAVPFAAAIEALVCGEGRGRWQAVVAGGALVAVWLVLLPTHVHALVRHPLTARVLALVSLAAPIALRGWPRPGQPGFDSTRAR